VEPVSVGQNSVVYSQVLEDLDDGERSAGEDALLRVPVVEEADVLVHVEDVLMRQTLYILVDGDNLLKVLVLAIAKDRIVDYDTIYRRVVVGIDEGVFEKFTVDFTELECEATVDLSISIPNAKQNIMK
jgi:hypothetical protein